jgi:acyl-CoA synthetase (AMP-forming)/AMP-acid ligase II
MMNYGETLAEWYLRFNGFFLMSRFVQHDYEVEPRVKMADCDLLAIRPPHVYEDVGGRPADWDVAFFHALGSRIGADTTAVIVEAKGGQGLDRIGNAFAPSRLRQHVRRIGLLPVETADRVARQLQDQASQREGDVVVAKVLAAHALQGRPRIAEGRLELPLTHANDFIKSRLRAYRDRKIAARHLFPSDLVQYLIWLVETEGR